MAVAILTLRRGTTTPSLAQSELFFNTSTNTLNVGGTSGLITLVKIGSNTGNITLTGNLSINGGISGSTLDITGDAKIDGNVLIGGNIVLGTGSNDIITVNAPFTGSLIPQEDGVDSLGSPSKRFKELHVVSASIDNISLPGSGILSSSNENFGTFSQSVDSRLDNLQLFTSSQEDLNQTFATTSSNTFIGDQNISGSIDVSGTIKSQVYINPKTLNGFTVPNGYNAMLVGPVDINGDVTLEGDSSLLILDKITLPDGLLSSSVTDFDTFSASIDSKVNNLAFATTESNTFVGNQTITGSIFMSGSTHQVGNVFLSGSLTVSGSSTFRNIGLTILSGSTLVSGGIDVNGSVTADNLKLRGTNRLITADSEQLIVSSSNTYFSGNVSVLGSVTASVFSGSFVGTLPSQDSRLNNLEQKSASVDLSISSLNQYTSSLKTAISVNGSDVTVNGNMVVLGTTTQINSTQVNIGENIIELNYGGAVTKGGLYVKDATGTLTSGSMLWDSSIDRWVSGPSGSESIILLQGGDNILSSSAQITSSLDFRYLEINGDNVFTGSSQVEIANTSGFSTFSGSLKSTDDGQDSRLNNLELTSQSHDGRLTHLESDSGSQGGRISTLEGFTSSQETINGFYNSYTSSNNNRISNLEGFTSSLQGVVSSSSDTSTITLSIQSGIISGSVIGGVVSGSNQLTSSLNTLYEVSGSVNQLVGIHQISGSLGSAAWYNVTTSLDINLDTSSLNDNIILSAGATKRFVVHVLDNVLNAADITSVNAGDGLGGGGTTGNVTLTLSTASQHFIDGVNSTISTFSQSVDTRLDSLESFSSSLDGGFVTQQELATATGSLIDSIAIKLDTGSYIIDSQSFDTRIDSLESFSSSLASGLVTQQELSNATSSLIDSIATKLNTGSYLLDSSSFDSRLDSLEGETNENPLTFTDTTTINFTRNVDTITADIIGGVVSGSSQVSYPDLSNIPSGIISSSSQITSLLPSGVVSGSSQVIYTSLSSIPSGIVSGSSQVSYPDLSNIPSGIVSSSNQVIGGSGILSSSNENYNTFSQSVDSRIDLLESNSSSLDGLYEEKASGTHTLVSGSSQLTSSYDSRYVTLNGDQTISGTKTFNDIVVNGTGSFAYITSVNGNAKVIGDSFIVVNTDTPTSRYAGLSVYDSGSTLSTASFYYDGQTNDWGYEYSSSAGIDYAVTIFGPEYTTKGTPTYLTSNRIPKAVDNHHLNDSNISDSGTLITLNSNSQVNGNLVVTGTVSATNLISGSSQVSYPALSNIPAGIVSGSSQVNADSITNFDTNVKDKLNADAVVSGSTQITKTLQDVTTAGNTTSTSISITNSTASTSKTTGALVVTGGIGTSGDVFAGGDVVAYASSDRRLKNNLELISNPLQKINQIGGYSFVWNEEKQDIYKGIDYGVIAQEIEEILPELVDTRENGYKAVKYDKLVSLLIEGIKDLSKQVDELKEKINRG